MTFRNRKVRPYNPKANPPVPPQIHQAKADDEGSVFEHSDLSDATKRALKQLLENKTDEHASAQS